MTDTACNVVYIHRAAIHYKGFSQNEFKSSEKAPFKSALSSNISSPDSSYINYNLQLLKQISNKVYVYTSGKLCISKLSELNKKSTIELIPTIILIHVPDDKDRLYERSRHGTHSVISSSPLETSEHRERESMKDEDEMKNDEYGLELIQRISLDIQCQTLSKLFVPVAMIDTIGPHGKEINLKSISIPTLQISQDSEQRTTQKFSLNKARMMRCMDMGAVDVLLSPISEERLPGLMTHAYRAYKNALTEHSANLVSKNKGRKVSWVGLDEQKPYAYLREAMVSGLMDGICQIPHHGPLPGLPNISLCPNRKKIITSAVGSWNFSAHEYTDDELLFSALLILQHILTMSELEPWRIPTENLIAFLFASRSAYNTFVPYHNFRHVVDVLQACFIFLVRLGRIPPYPNENALVPSCPSVFAESIQPYDALTLLITAIGHDVGHPGVNNAFLVTLNAPLAQLYNDRSVLESFHCAAFSQILRRHWPAAFKDVGMRKLMISSILATDMGLHFDYMKKMARVPEKLSPEAMLNGSKVWPIEEQRTLACSLLIKCADISNVARKYDIASRWTTILTDEFARQAIMEEELGIPSTLFAPPVREVIELGKSQLDFMETFAFPLFEGITDVMPAMKFCVEELHLNKSIWQEKINQELNNNEDEKNIYHKDDKSCISGPNQGEGPSNFVPQRFNEPSDCIPKQKHNLEHIDLKLNTENIWEHCPFPNSVSSPSNISNFRLFSPLNTSNDYSVACHPQSDSTGQISPVSLLSNQMEAPTKLTENSEKSILLNGDCLTTRKTNVRFSRLEKGRRSDGTEASSSSTTGDWTSQDFSDNLPRSPSTKGSSITLDSDNSDEETNINQHPDPKSTLDHIKCPDEEACQNKTKSTEDIDSSMKCVLVVQKSRALQKKPSRFRMNFWKKNKKDIPSPVLFDGVESGEGSEASSWGCGLGSNEIAYRAIVKEKILKKS